MVSTDHFMIICPSPQKFCTWGSRTHTYAADVVVGDTVWVTHEGVMQQELVLSIDHVSQQGMFNPYTLSGTIVVDDVVVSAHSSWVMDRWTPKSHIKYLPHIYQILFFPGRVLYRMFGPSAAMMLDVDNPQKQMAGLGPHFLVGTLLLLLLVAHLTLHLMVSWSPTLLAKKGWIPTLLAKKGFKALKESQSQLV